MTTDTTEAVGRLFDSAADTPDMSVVIPTYNRSERLLRVLGKLEEQQTNTASGHRFSFEVIVVSDGSTDGTRGILEAFEASSFALIPMYQENRGPAAARNAGILEASGEVVVFLDDDVLPEPGFLSAHMNAHRSHDDLVVVGPMLTPEGTPLQPWIAWEQFQLEKQYARLDAGELLYPRQFYTGNASVRRSALVEVGLFNTSLLRSEDIDMGLRLETAGQTFSFVAGARAFHYAQRTFESWSNVAYEYGKNDVEFSEDRQRDGLADISGYFAERSLPQRMLVTWLRPGTARHALGVRVLSALARVCGGLRLRTPTRLLLSAVYALHYYLSLIHI